MVIASDSILAASTLIAGSSTRSLKSSRARVRSTEVKFRSTPFWVWIFRSAVDSVVSSAAPVLRVGPLRTTYWLGKRIFRVSPILAPWRAKLSS